MLSGFVAVNNPIAKGVVKPKENNNPAKKRLIYPNPLSEEIIPDAKESVKIIYARIIQIVSAKSLGYLNPKSRLEKNDLMSDSNRKTSFKKNFSLESLFAGIILFNIERQ